MRYIFLCCMMLISTPAMAFVTAVSVSPTSREVSISGTSNVVVTWIVTTNANGGPNTMIGQPGMFKIAGNPVGTSTRTLSRSFNFAGVGDVRIVENISVPRSVILAAQRQGAALGYERFFSDDNNFNNSDEVTLVVASGAAGQAGLAGQTLTFEDGADYRSVKQNQKLRAQARVTASGSGILRAVWEVADNFGAGNSPSFRPLQNVTKPIGGNKEILLISPLLPTQSLGRVQVRLRQISPETDETLPTIDYFVTKTGEEDPDAPFEPKIPASKGGGLK